jgi:hypothetical protein
VGAAALHGRVQQLARRVDLPALESGDAAVQQFFRFALLFRQRAARPIDVGPRRAWLRSRKSARVQTSMACA